MNIEYGIYGLRASESVAEPQPQQKHEKKNEQHLLLSEAWHSAAYARAFDQTGRYKYTYLYIKFIGEERRQEAIRTNK